MQYFSEFSLRSWGEALEERLSLSVMTASDPTVPRPPSKPPKEPVPTPEPSPGPYPDSDPPIVFPPPPLGGPVGPA
jgi:hypothetical protein